MKNIDLAAALCLALMLASNTMAQGPIVINDPTKNDAVSESTSKLSASEQKLMDNVVLPAARKILADDGCQEEVEVAGRQDGAFTAAGSRQTAVFYQFCQTGNGFGTAGVAIFEKGRLAGNFVAKEAGWAIDSAVLPDINKNGINEIALYYSGGMHQGEGGTGVDIVEFGGGRFKGLGWYQSDGYSATGPQWGYKVTVTPATTPAFFKEKYVGNSSNKWRRSGKAMPLRLGKVTATFEAVK